MKKAYIIPKHRIAEIDLSEPLLSKSDISEEEGDVFDVRGERHFGSEEGSTGRRNIWDNEW